jgi:hypothetical protein
MTIGFRIDHSWGTPTHKVCPMCKGLGYMLMPQSKQRIVCNLCESKGKLRIGYNNKK